MMIKFQAQLDKYARDVFDESDVPLAIRTQLIYPSGSQVTIDGHPLRWQCIQTILRLVHSHVIGLQKRYPRSIEVVERTFDGYPFIYFLRSDIETVLITEIVDAICKGQTSLISCIGFSNAQRQALKDYISTPVVKSGVTKLVNKMFQEKTQLLKVADLLRGLLVHRILLSTLKKRWNVQYGLHPDRDPIAVPFSAKGVPSLTAEWGHPDVAIVLVSANITLSSFRISASLNDCHRV